ncbi:hypothetical protein AgCh_040068 [Apium graveolens]
MDAICRDDVPQFPVFESYDVNSITWLTYEIPFKQAKGGLPQKYQSFHKKQIEQLNARKPAEAYMTAIKRHEFTASVNSASAQLSIIPMLNGTNYVTWKENFEIVLGCMDLDLALRKEQPIPTTDDPKIDQTEEWKRSNSMCLEIMKRTILNGFQGSIVESTSAKKFLSEIEQYFAKNETAETSNLLSKPMTIKYKGKGNIREYIIGMSNLVGKLKELKLELSDELFVHLILISLSPQFGHFVGKQTNSRKLGAKRATSILELIHTDICGSFPTASWNGQRYFIRFIDNYSRYGYLYLIHEKSQALDVFKEYKDEVELQLISSIKAVRSDRGGEYYGRYDGSGEQYPGPFVNFLKECGIVPQYTMPGKSNMNGVAERRNRTLKDMVRTEARPYRPNEKKLDSRMVSSYFVGIGEDDPVNLQHAMQSPNSQKWIDAMNEEMQSMKENDIWDLVELHKGSKPICCKWVFKTKRDLSDNIERYKARLVAKAFTQKKGIDYNETFSPVTMTDSFIIFMEIVAHYNLELQQMDVKATFLNGNIGLLHDTKKFLTSQFEMKDLGNDSFVLRIQIHRDRSRGFIGLSQKSYIEKILERYGMKDCAPMDTPVSKGDKFSLKQCPKNELKIREMQRITYASVVGSLMRSDHLEIIGYSDSDFGGCKDERKSTSGYVYLLAGGAISWRSAKQTLIASSTMVA